MIATTEINLGDKVKDALTGFTGIAVGYTEWLYGCVRIAIESEKLDKDGKPQDELWFDKQRVVLVKTKRASKAKQVSKAISGGPQSDPSHSSSRA